MSEKTKQILENLKAISKKETTEVDPGFQKIPFSNFYDWDENGKELYRDRLYGDMNGKSRLLNKDGTQYRGKIYKRRITVKGLDGTNFFSHSYETEDGRWFDRVGLPCEKPSTLVKQSDNSEEDESK